MKCDHCSKLVQMQGGLRISGEINVSIGIACPCPEFVRVPDNVEYVLPGISPILESFTHAIWFFPFRFCTRVGPNTRVRIIDFECSNYSIDDLAVNSQLKVFNKTPGICSPVLFPGPVATATWVSGESPSSDTFLTTDGDLNSFILEMGGEITTGFDMTEPPAITITVMFDHPP